MISSSDLEVVGFSLAIGASIFKGVEKRKSLFAGIRWWGRAARLVQGTVPPMAYSAKGRYRVEAGEFGYHIRDIVGHGWVSDSLGPMWMPQEEALRLAENLLADPVDVPGQDADADAFTVAKEHVRSWQKQAQYQVVFPPGKWVQEIYTEESPEPVAYVPSAEDKAFAKLAAEKPDEQMSVAEWQVWREEKARQAHLAFVRAQETNNF